MAQAGEIGAEGGAAEIVEGSFQRALRGGRDIGFEACENNSGDIGNRQCKGVQVCKDNTADIP